MRFRLVVDGDPRRIEVERGPEGILIRVDGAEYRGKVRRVHDGIEVRLGPKWRRVRLVGRTALTDDATHEIAISEIEDEPSDRKSTRLNSSHVEISYAVFCLKKKKTQKQ